MSPKQRSAWTLLCLGVVLSTGTALSSPMSLQSVQNRPTFDVASIKENRSGRIESFAYPYANTGRLLLVNHTTRQMIRQAYDLREYQVTGGPDWLDRTRYDVEAKVTNAVTRQLLMRMLQSLLEDDFKLVARQETRDGSILVLREVTPGKPGSGLLPATPQDARLNPVGAQPGGGLRGSAATMADLAATLSNIQGRLVLDKTGLTGIYNFTVTYGEERRIPPGVPADALPPQRQDLPTLPTALREQLGLHLESARGPVPMLLIDSARQPTVNGYSATAEPLQNEPPK